MHVILSERSEPKDLLLYGSLQISVILSEAEGPVSYSLLQISVILSERSEPKHLHLYGSLQISVILSEAEGPASYSLLQISVILSEHSESKDLLLLSGALKGHDFNRANHRQKKTESFSPREKSLRREPGVSTPGKNNKITVGFSPGNTPSHLQTSFSSEPLPGPLISRREQMKLAQARAQRGPGKASHP
jgi:hypothetical protein